MTRKHFLSAWLVALVLAGSLISCGSNDKAKDKKDNKGDEPEVVSKIELVETEYAPGQEIKLSYETNAELFEKPWIGIIPSEVKHGAEAENDAHDLTYQYFDGKPKGEMVFAAPDEPGEYDFRMHDKDDGEDGKELASVSFVVTAPVSTETFEVGEQVCAKWQSSWYQAKIVSVDKETDTYHVEYSDGTADDVLGTNIRKIMDKEAIAEGVKVLAVWTSDKFYPGVVEAVQADGAMVKWDDGSAASLVAFDKIAKP